MCASSRILIILKHLDSLKAHLQTGGEFHHLFGLNVPQPVHTSDTVTDGQHTAGLLQISTSFGSKNLLLQNTGHLRCA